jgi:hypothetical protein
MSMSEPDLIERLASAVARHIKPAIPLSIDMWDISTIAEYIKRDPATVRERLACLPDFPPAVRLPSAKGHKGQPLYKATEVISWVEKYKEKH